MNDDDRGGNPAPVAREEYEQLLFDQRLLETDVARLAESIRELSRLFVRHVDFQPSRASSDVGRVGKMAEDTLSRIKARWRARDAADIEGGGDAA